MTEWVNVNGYWHTRKCAEYQARLEESIKEWDAKYPDHCPSCEGERGHTHTENGAPHGAGYWPMDVTEPCEACWDRCSRCGADLQEVLPKDIVTQYILDELDKQYRLALQNGYYQKMWFMDYLDKVEIWDQYAQTPCPVCGWNWGKNQDDRRPYEFDECACGYHQDNPNERTYDVPDVYKEFEDLYVAPDAHLEAAYEDRTYYDDGGE